MANLKITMAVKDYDYIAPLAYGDVAPEGIDLTVLRDTMGALVRVPADPSVQVGEMSLGRHLVRLARGDRSIVAIPFFPNRGFRHRCFFVRRDSGLHSFKDLEGKRVGTDEWPATGNVWSRAALREQGVRIDAISWTVGSIDGIVLSAHRPQGQLPPCAQLAAPGSVLREMLLAGELDALMCPHPPKGFYEVGSPIVRLFQDFQRAEREYYLRTGVNPIHHILGMRREDFERNPWVARNLFLALDECKKRFQEERLWNHESSPWLLTGLEDAVWVMGRDWHPNGVESSRKVIQTLAEELYAQDLMEKPLDGSLAFTEFEQVTASQGA